MDEQLYVGEAFIGTVGPETIPAECRDSIDSILRRAGDLPPCHTYATKGYEARQMHINTFLYKTKKDWLLLLDHDMTFPPGTLEQLRQHGKPYVSGYYMRRSTKPIAPVWFKPFQSWPMEPWGKQPEKGKLHELGASGWGCILIHREVLERVRDEILKDEPHVIEDDMDVWPYDLAVVMKALGTLRALVADKPRVAILRPALAECYRVLAHEIRPIRGRKEPVGSDIRFPFLAKACGYTLWGDPDVRCGHNIQYRLSPDDYEAVTAEGLAETQAKLDAHLTPIRKETAKILRRLKRLSGSWQ